MVSEQKCSRPSVLPVGNTSGGPNYNTGKQSRPEIISPYPDDNALGIDGVSISWPRGLLYAFPPPVLVPLI